MSFERLYYTFLKDGGMRKVRFFTGTPFACM